MKDQVYDEIYNVLGDGDEPISIQDVNRLPFLEQVLMETLRLYPIAPMIFRELEDDVKISTQFFSNKWCTLYMYNILNFSFRGSYTT